MNRSVIELIKLTQRFSLESNRALITWRRGGFWIYFFFALRSFLFTYEGLFFNWHIRQFDQYPLLGFFCLELGMTAREGHQIADFRGWAFISILQCNIPQGPKYCTTTHDTAVLPFAVPKSSSAFKQMTNITNFFVYFYCVQRASFLFTT